MSFQQLHDMCKLNQIIINFIKTKSRNNFQSIIINDQILIYNYNSNRDLCILKIDNNNNNNSN